MKLELVSSGLMVANPSDVPECARPAFHEYLCKKTHDSFQRLVTACEEVEGPVLADVFYELAGGLPPTDITRRHLATVLWLRPTHLLGFWIPLVLAVAWLALAVYLWLKYAHAL